MGQPKFWAIKIWSFLTTLRFRVKKFTLNIKFINWAAPSEFGTYRLCEQRRFRRACASAQSRQNLRCSLIQAVSQVEPSDRKPDPWPIWIAGHAQLKFVMTECSKTQIRLARLNSVSRVLGTEPMLQLPKSAKGTVFRKCVPLIKCSLTFWLDLWFYNRVSYICTLT